MESCLKLGEKYWYGLGALLYKMGKLVLYLKYYIIYNTSKVHTSLQKRGIPPPQNEGQAELHPPIFITAHTPSVHEGV